MSLNCITADSDTNDSTEPSLSLDGQVYHLQRREEIMGIVEEGGTTLDWEYRRQRRIVEDQATSRLGKYTIPPPATPINKTNTLPPKAHSLGIQPRTMRMQI